jgi:hypothetical protein
LKEKIMKTKWIILLAAALVAFLPLNGLALVVTRSYDNSTSDNDNHSQEDASSSQTTIGLSSTTLTTAGSSSGNMGYRFIGQASAYDEGNLTQNIDVTVTWTVTAESWEEYSISLTPELHAYLNIYDYSTDESDDDADFNTLSSVLRVNGGIVSDTLNGLTGLQRSTDGSSNLDRTDSQILTGYTGNNIFSLQLTGTVFVDAHADGGVFDNPTGNAVLWGQDGNLDFEQNASQDGFDEYSSTSARNADGLFVDADITLDQVPEPASALMIVVGGGLIGMIRRIYRRF